MMRLMEYTTSTYTSQQFFSTADATSNIIFSSDSSYTTEWETSSSRSSWRLLITADRSSYVSTLTSSTQLPMTFFTVLPPYNSGSSTSSYATFSVATSYTTSSNMSSELKGTETETSTSTASIYRLGPFHATISEESASVQYEHSFTSRTTSYTSQYYTGNITSSLYDITNANIASAVISSTRHEWYEVSKYTTTYISSQETINNQGTHTYITYNYSTSFYSKNDSFYTSSLSTSRVTLPSQVSVNASIVSYRETQYETSTTEKSLLDFTSTYSMWGPSSLSSWTGTREFWGYYTTENVTYFPIKHLTSISTGIYRTLNTVNYNTVSSSAAETTPISQVIVFPKNYYEYDASSSLVSSSVSTFTNFSTSYFFNERVTVYISTYMYYSVIGHTSMYRNNTSMFFESTVYDTTVMFNYTSYIQTIYTRVQRSWLSSTISIIHNPSIAASMSTVTSTSSSQTYTLFTGFSTSDVSQISSTYT